MEDKNVQLCKELFEIVSDEVLEKIAKETKVNFQVKKLFGKDIFKLLCFGLLSNENASLRTLEEDFSSEEFKNLSKMDKFLKTKHTSISDRLGTMNPEFSKKVYEYVLSVVEEKYGKEFSLFQNKWNLRRFDSTIVSLSEKLLKFGMDNKTGKKQIKFTIGYKNFPTDVRFYKEQKDSNENRPLSETILDASLEENEIVIFDRGLCKNSIFKEFGKRDIKFVTRLKKNIKYSVLENKEINKEIGNLKIEKDQIVEIRGIRFRLVEGTLIKSSEKIRFLTNITDEFDAEEIAEIYRERWKIEEFFRFIKQELKFEHLISNFVWLLSRTEKGIKNVMYVRLILAIFLLVFKKN